MWLTAVQTCWRRSVNFRLSSVTWYRCLCALLVCRWVSSLVWAHTGNGNQLINALAMIYSWCRSIVRNRLTRWERAQHALWWKWWKNTSHLTIVLCVFCVKVNLNSCFQLVILRFRVKSAEKHRVEYRTGLYLVYLRLFWLLNVGVIYQI